MHVYILLDPYTPYDVYIYLRLYSPYTSLYTPMHINALYIFTYIYAQIHILVYTRLRPHIYTCWNTSRFIYPYMFTYIYTNIPIHVFKLPHLHTDTCLHTSTPIYLYIFIYFYDHIQPIHTSTLIYQFTYFYVYMHVCMCMYIISNLLKISYSTLRSNDSYILLILKAFNLKKSCKIYFSIANIRNTQIITISSLQIYIYYIFQIPSFFNKNYIKKYFV